MQKNEISISFNVDVNKIIFKQSPWNNNYQDFLEETILKHIHGDEFINRAVKKLSENEQQQYAGFLKTTENISEDIRQSVSYNFLEKSETTQKNNYSF